MERMNFSVLEEVKPTRSLEAAIFQLKLQYFGHIMRAEGSMEQDIMLGQVAGYRK
jgi:6-phosphofructokinase